MNVSQAKTMQPAYNIAFHVHCDISLSKGRIISLVSLTQTLTYDGLLESYPTKKCNDAELQEVARRASTHGCRFHLLQPARRSYLRCAGDMDALPHRFGTPEWLPMVRCSARFRSAAIEADRADASTLELVWYQDEFALPIAEAILREIVALPWDMLANDVEY